MKWLVRDPWVARTHTQHLLFSSVGAIGLMHLCFPELSNWEETSLLPPLHTHRPAPPYIPPSIGKGFHPTLPPYTPHLHTHKHTRVHTHTFAHGLLLPSRPPQSMKTLV